MAEFERTITVSQLLEDQSKELNLEILLGQKYTKREIAKANDMRFDCKLNAGEDFWFNLCFMIYCEKMCTFEF